MGSAITFVENQYYHGSTAQCNKAQKKVAFLNIKLPTKEENDSFFELIVILTPFTPIFYKS